MADHINIQDPEHYNFYRTEHRDALEMAKLRAELDLMKRLNEAIAANLKSIFTRIGRGESAELHYIDGRVFVITGQERN